MIREPARVPVARVERRRLALARRLNLAGVLGYPLYCLAGAWISDALRSTTWNGLPMMFLMLMPLWTFIAGLVVSRRRAVASDSVLVSDGALQFAPGGAEVARAEVIGGAVVPGAPPAVRVETRSGDQWFVTPADPNGEARLLASLGLDASKHTWEVSASRVLLRILLWILSPFFTIFGGAAFVWLSKALNLGDYGNWVVALVGVCLTFAGLVWVDRVGLVTKVTVGTDAVAVRSWARTKALSLDGLASVRKDHAHLVFRYESGAERRVRFNPDDGAQTAVLLRRIEEAMAARRGRGRDEGPALLESALARQGAGFDAWRKSLGGLLERAEGYRTATVTRGDLRALVTDAAASVEQRVAAVMALAQGGDPELGERVRAAVDSAAVPRVRVALERAAEGSLDEGELRAAIEAEADARKAGGAR